jgi:hypothetical protein
VIKIKKCVTCGAEKNISEFSICKNNHRCDTCHKEYAEIDGMKKCTKCKIIKPKEDFKKSKKGKYSYICKKCHAARNREIRRERKEKGVRLCSECKYEKPLQFFSNCLNDKKICNDCIDKIKKSIKTMTCKECNEKKYEDEFYTYHRGGKEYKNKTCIECVIKQKSQLYSFNDIKKKLEKEYFEEENKHANCKQERHGL